MPTFVKYKDTTIGYVSSDQLQTLLESKLIISYQRSGKWVVLGMDSIREQGSQTKYNGPDRRRKL